MEGDSSPSAGKVHIITQESLSDVFKSKKTRSEEGWKHVWFVLKPIDPDDCVIIKEYQSPTLVSGLS